MSRNHLHQTDLVTMSKNTQTKYPLSGSVEVFGICWNFGKKLDHSYNLYIKITNTRVLNLNFDFTKIYIMSVSVKYNVFIVP